MDIVANSSLVEVSPLKRSKRLDLDALALFEKQYIINMYKQMLSGKQRLKCVKSYLKL